jgi:hypothetical protein
VESCLVVEITPAKKTATLAHAGNVICYREMLRHAIVVKQAYKKKEKLVLTQSQLVPESATKPYLVVNINAKKFVTLAFVHRVPSL